ncbi:Transposase DDE domain protein [Piscirickettsia salmonis]|uniref:Transposase n=3 Tax=Piscirickettsia salmonis TaxID=1238 RepID=A0AAC8VHI9_PISSA|nr:IS982 family transposase [Piscirickettsia salmonis]ALB22376.1 transposase [Piscirickettsia salmonis]ALB22542.1 transposase [Piscirickettsia salmonis]ALT18308.1 transposase [Piscirickettsia salmonis LF-89 = ATCC VR-1361]ALT18344.1 transposase [Piscirickettsia salmonis LF-89 = ATCC VR-1361]ALY02454.1 transposase [Piscirickettsia salmonis]
MDLTLISLFCVIDDFCQELLPQWNAILLEDTNKKRNKPSQMSTSEIMTIMIYFHKSNYRNFKMYYLHVIKGSMVKYFPNSVSYNRFVELMPSILLPLCFFIAAQGKTATGIYFVDSTILRVCHEKRASQNRVFKGLAKKSKSTMGWYYGFKVHIIVNDMGELMAFKMSKATTDDRVVLPKMAENLTGKIIGDKGYISQKLFDQLYEKGLQLITKIRKNMKNKLVLMIDKILLRKRGIIESVFDQLKNISQIEHSRHRSADNFMVNIVAGLAAYCLQEKKPSLGIKYNLLNG